MNHIDELTYLRYLDGRLDQARAREIDEHSSTCSSCRQMFEALEHETTLLRESLSEADEP